MKLLYCFISDIKHLCTKCFCISTKTEYSDKNIIINVPNDKLINEMGIIYEEIEYKNLKDL